METIRVWTVKRPPWWDELQLRGVKGGDGRRVDRDFLPAYRWMMNQMHRRIPDYRGGFPVWFWCSPKPDLRDGGHLARGEHGLLIELELRRGQVLLSDFDAWHAVLNRWHLSLSWRESEDWEARTRGLDPFRKALPAALEAELQATWERIFDLKGTGRKRLWGAVRSIQGVTEHVRLNQVRSVREFIAR